MLLSIFTPTHNPSWLLEAFETIRPQPGPWEWLIYGDPAVFQYVSPSIRRHPWVKLIPYQKDQTPETLRRIGALKSQVCGFAEGEVLVELDHDDFLAPDILDSIRQAFDEEGAGFAYSDVAPFFSTLSGRKYWPHVYSPIHGWENYTTRVYDLDWSVTRPFPVTPRSLCEIYYAPDHVRCWRRTLYEDIGGHNPELPVGDDHDLMCRTYISGAKFHHIEECGYFYRMHGNNSFTDDPQVLGRTVAQSRSRYLWPLVNEWSRRNRYLIVTADSPGQLSMTRENQAGAVLVKHLLSTHVRPEELTLFMNDAYKALAPGGWLMIEVDPQVHPIESFHRYCRRSLAREDRAIQCRFQCLAAHIKQYDESGQAQLMLCALKGQRQPGQVLI